MSAVATAELLRPGLLEGVSILVAHAGTGGGPDRAHTRRPPNAGAESSRPPGGPGGPGDASLHAALTDSARTTAARVTDCELPVEEESFARQLKEDGLPDLLVVDAAGVFAADGEPARDALGRTMHETWEVTRAVAAGLIEQQRPGRIVLVAPPEGAGAGDGGAGAVDARTHARAARAGLENLARTTSIEWARYGITIVAITPGAETTCGVLGALCAYLASPAGAYFSGCVLALAGNGPASRPAA